MNLSLSNLTLDNPSDAISITCSTPTKFACSLSTLLSHFKRLGKIIHGRKSFLESFSSHPKLTIIFWIFLGTFISQDKARNKGGKRQNKDRKKQTTRN
ncbi:hypothetical protein K1719_015313 [Acacia pycnantha]|nr:hypothetical protein K1719_015313 [Acacia pycnantha]